jgi:hypothetical protein
VSFVKPKLFHQEAIALPARLAQSVERETLNLKAAGSTPALGSIPDAFCSTEQIRLSFAFFFFFNFHFST